MCVVSPIYLNSCTSTNAPRSFAVGHVTSEEDPSFHNDGMHCQLDNDVISKIVYLLYVQAGVVRIYAAVVCALREPGRVTLKRSVYHTSKYVQASVVRIHAAIENALLEPGRDIFKRSVLTGSAHTHPWSFDNPLPSAVWVSLYQVWY